MSDHGYRKSHGMGKDIQMKLGRPQEDYRETEKVCHSNSLEVSK